MHTKQPRKLRRMHTKLRYKLEIYIMNIRKGLFTAVATSAVVGALLIGSVAFADSSGEQGHHGKGFGIGIFMRAGKPVMGQVTAISGNTITLAAKAPKHA